MLDNAPLTFPQLITLFPPLILPSYKHLFMYIIVHVFIFSPFHKQFADLLERDGAAKASLQFRRATVFAPTNQAFQRYPDLKVNVLYHISKLNIFFSNISLLKFLLNSQLTHQIGWRI